MDISDFYQTFFDEADELFAQMEQNLLMLDPAEPDLELLNAIFRAAHSIKGGAATFGFTVLQETTHLLENILDSARRHELSLTTEIINVFLETKDIMQDQIDAYKSSKAPDAETFDYICKALQQIALDNHKDAAKTPQKAPESAAEPISQNEETHHSFHLVLTQLKNKEAALLLEELNALGEVMSHHEADASLTLDMLTTVSEDDIIAILCFIIDTDQITITENKPASATCEINPKASPAESKNTQPIKEKPVAKTTDSSIRVSIEKVDNLINLVGELVITQSMLTQSTLGFDPSEHSDLLNSMSLLERGARALQEAVMSIRMMPMDVVFSRYPRLVRDLASKLGKKVELILEGSSTELDKGLIEKIIDPLTHLIRNSLDHGIEAPEIRKTAGKNETGKLILSAEHQGGNIYIDVIDDGAGLNRDKIIAKARAQGMDINDEASDKDIANLIFAPGFSTAEEITDVSGRGVGMDVVKRNINEMGGHIEIESETGKGTTFRIVVPLTLAILDAMSVKAGDETFILPLSAVMESMQPEEKDFYCLAGGEQVLHVRGEYLPLVKLRDLFAITTPRPDTSRDIVLILQADRRRYALLVDQLLGQQQVVVKNLEKNYRKVDGISGATIMGNGNVALIIDVDALQRMNKGQRQAALQHVS